MTAAVDHLVVAAADLATGAAWCGRVLGVAPAAGGAHPLMGTHNRLLALGGAAFAGAYFEVIARDPQATPQRPAGTRRWFDLDDAALQQRLQRHGPRLVHWVARVDDPAAASAALAALGIDSGPWLAASRDTPTGRLAWRIAVRDDGQRPFGGCLPALIAWDGAAHPAASLPPAGLALQSLRLAHPEAPRLRAALEAIGLGAHPGIAVEAAAVPTLIAQLDTPRGPVVLRG